MNLVANDRNSVVCNATGEFDDVIAKSRVYRNVLRNRQAATTSDRGAKTAQPSPQRDGEEAKRSLPAEGSAYRLGGKRAQQSVSLLEKREARPRSPFYGLAKAFPRFQWKPSEGPASPLKCESPNVASLEGDAELVLDPEALNPSIVGLGEPEWDVSFKVYSFWGSHPVSHQAKDGYPYLEYNAAEVSSPQFAPYPRGRFPEQHRSFGYP